MSTFVPAQLPGVEQVLFRLRGVPHGAVAQFLMERLIGKGQNYTITRVLTNNPSATLVAANIHLATLAVGGTPLSVPGLLTGATTPLTGHESAPNADGRGRRGDDIWYRVTVASAGAATGDAYVIGIVL